MFIKREHHHFKQIDRIAAIGLVSGLSMASVGTIWAIYLESILKNPSYVGYLISFFTIITLVSFIFTIPLVERKSKTKLYFFSLIAYFFALVLFSILSNLYAVILLGIFISILVSIRLISFGLIISDKSKSSSLSKNEGMIYTFSNLAWLIGPLIAGFVSVKYGMRAVFAVAAIFLLLAIILFIKFRVEDNRVQKKIDKNPIKIMAEFFREKRVRICYVLSGAVNFWWVLIYIYIPLFIVNSGYSGKYVGYFLFAVVIPLIALEYFFGKLAGKKGFKKIFFAGYLIMGLFAILSFFVNNLFFILALLVLASIGASMVESTTEAYFFDIIPANKKDRYYGPYNTTIEVNYALASFSGALMLSFLDFKFLFILFGAVMISVALLSLKIRNVIESRKR